MRKFKTCRPRTLPFRLLVPVASALLLTAAFIPRADALTNPPGSTVVSYFNFEDTPPGPGGLPLTSPVDVTPDFNFATVAQPIPNAGGGVETSTTNLTILGNATLDTTSSGLLTNRTTGDSDIANPGHAIGVRRTASNPAFTISFTVNTEFYQGLSLSFAVNNAGNGYHNVALTWTGAPGTVPAQTITTTTTLITFTLPPSVNGNGITPQFVTFTLTFSNGQSNGNNADETVIDNIQLTAGAVIPEPATVAGGLLGVIGLCWFQRRRIRLILPRLRRA